MAYSRGSYDNRDSNIILLTIKVTKMAVYARKDGTLYVQFRLNGKTYIKSTGAKNKTQANALEAKMRAELNQTVRRQLPCPVGDNYLDRLTDM